MKRIIRCGSSEESIRLEIADTFVKRFCGLMLRKELQEGAGLLLMPCVRVHTCFMRFPIDVLYLDESRRIIGKETLHPWKAGKYIQGTKAVIELCANAARDISLGEKIIGLE